MVRDKFYIVAIGASAGGNKVIWELFAQLTEPANAAFVVIQHLHRDFQNLNLEILSRYTQMKIYKVQDHQQVRPGCIYLLGENKMMTISKGYLQVRLRHPGEVVNRAVDIFFHSLAEDMQERAIGVILSGGDGDGAQGARHIHQHGGLVLVQEPETAQHPGMPKAAIHQDNPQYILPPDKLVQKLMDIIQLPVQKKN